MYPPFVAIASMQAAASPQAQGNATALPICSWLWLHVYCKLIQNVVTTERLHVQDAKSAGFLAFGRNAWTRLRDTQVSTDV